ncbi:hypothetical protein E4U32_002359 [Claviceps aff. humidiphila group G2b]|nr:hypothetical protein E4U32_002359 [Claviceps aff. humidiphila group G2b]
MASRSGAGSSGLDQNDPRDEADEFPPLPRSAPRLPPLRALNGDLVLPPPGLASLSSLATSTRPAASRYWSTAARRAERIRNIYDHTPTSDDLGSSTMDHPWLTSSRRALHLRPIYISAAERDRLARPADLDELDHLDEANTQLRTLLDMTTQVHLMTPLLQSTTSPTVRSRDVSDDDNIRSKRRRVGSNPPVPSSRGFRYGRYGQVEPGRLRMEIVSCDGGMFSNESFRTADNILNDDVSTYCSTGNRCNIVLRHQDATVFALEELVIKTPGGKKSSHPVTEGLVFISMDENDLLNRTAHYQIQYTDQPHSPRSDDAAASQPPSERDATPRHIVSIRHHNDGTSSTRIHHSRSPSLSQNPASAGYPWRLPDMPPEFDSYQPHFNITTERTSDDEENLSQIPRTLRRPPNRIGSLPFETESSDSDPDTPQPLSTNFTRYLDRQLSNSSDSRYTPREEYRARETDRDPYDVSLFEAWEAHNSATQDAIRAVGGGLLVPHAKFYIDREKSQCTIRFTPAVSGRFILLKLWGRRFDGVKSVYVQSVVAKGFAGPRYFPSVQLA